MKIIGRTQFFLEQQLAQPDCPIELVTAGATSLSSAKTQSCFISFGLFSFIPHQGTAANYVLNSRNPTKA